MNNTMMQREKYELYLRDIVSEVIDDTGIVKSIVDKVFDKIIEKDIHVVDNSEDSIKKDLVFSTRANLIQYFYDNNIYDNYMKKLVNNVNEQSVKFMVCNEYFGKSEYLKVVDINNTQSLIDIELDKLSNIEREIVIRKYYFLQSNERISKSLDMSLLEIEIISKSAIKKLWKQIINNDEIYSNDVNSNKREIRTLKKNLHKHLNDISRRKNMKKTHISALNIQEYFIIKVLGETSLSEIELIFDDICLEGMSRCKPSEEEKVNLKYLFMYRNTSKPQLKKRQKKRKCLKAGVFSIGAILSMMAAVLIFGKSRTLAKIDNKDTAYSVRCEKLGMDFIYTFDKDDINVSVNQLYFVKDNLEKDYSYRLDTELAKRINRHNLYADSIDEQTVYEAASVNYLASEKEEAEYVQGERRYVHSKKHDVLFVVEYKDDAWECIKVIYVNELGVNSKYRLDENVILKGFYKESADGDWKCEVQLTSNDENTDTFTEVTFISDDSKVASEGIYRTGNLVYNRTFNASTATMEMDPVSDLSKNNYGDNFITYIEENDEVIFYYNYYEDSKFICDEIGKVEKDILEEIAGYIEEYPKVIRHNIDEYGICIPQTNQYILPYITNESENSDYISNYKEFSYYQTRSLFGTNSEQLKILTYSEGKIANYDKIYRLNSEEYYENIAVLTTYRQEVLEDNYVAFTYDNNIFKYRVFNNEFVEILKYKGAASNVSIPDYIDGLEVKYIANDAFYGKDSIVEVEIPETVVEIGDYAFKNCKKLQRVVINGKVISYGDGAYEGCKKLETIKCEKSPMYIGRNCFKGTSILSNMKKKDGVKYFKNVAVSYVGKDEFIEIKEGTQGIADGFIGEGKKYVQEVIIPDSVKYIGESAFEGAEKLKEVELPKNLVYIGEYAFSECQRIDDINIPKYIKVINEGVFANCTNLNKVHIGSGVKVIMKNAFKGIGNIDVVNVSSKTKCVFPSAFDEDVKVVKYKK